MSSIAKEQEEDLAVERAVNYKVGREVTEEEREKLDYRDESLKQWEKSVGLVQTGADASLPNVQVINLTLSFEDGQRQIVIDPSKGLVQTKTPVTIKEGSEFTVTLTFKVNHAVVPGLVYVQRVSRGPISSKQQQMIGSHGPNTEAYSKKFASEEAPSGLLARGTYTVTSRVVDDDNKVHLDLKWSFTIQKSW